MSVNQHPKYPGHWVIRFYPGGKKKDPATGKVKREYIVFKGTQAEAEAYHLELIRASRPDRIIVATPTFSQMFSDFAEYYKNKSADNTFTDFLVKWKKMKDTFGHLRPNNLTPAMIESYKSTRLAQGLKPSSINKELNFLAAFISWATDPAIGLANPMSFQIRRFPKKMSAAPIPIVPTREQIMAVIDQVYPPRVRKDGKIAEDHPLAFQVRSLAALLYLGGLRYSEAANLAAEDILKDQGAMIVRKGKGDKPRVVPIVPPVVPFLEKLLEKIPSGKFFLNPKTGKPIGSIKKTLAAAGIRTGIPVHIHAHLLRHGFGVHSTMDGVGLRALQDVMGHASSTTTELYSRLAAQALIDEFQKWGQKGTKNEEGVTDKNP